MFTHKTKRDGLPDMPSIFILFPKSGGWPLEFRPFIAQYHALTEDAGRETPSRHKAHNWSFPVEQDKCFKHTSKCAYEAE